MGCDLVIDNATLVGSRWQRQANLYVKDGKVVAVGQYECDSKERVDASGLFALPGAIDPHVHLMDPGYTHVEQFETGTGAAAVGGTTTVVEHHRTDPQVLNVQVLTEKAAYLADKGLVDYALFGGVEPDNLDQIEPMWHAGASAFKAFTCNLHGVQGVFAAEMLEAFTILAHLGAPILVHAEDETMIARNARLLHDEGRTDAGVILAWRTRAAEQVAVSTVARLALLSGAKVIIAHASHPAVVEIIAHARAQGADLWCESCPQYFYLDEEEILAHGPWRKFTPPARDRQAAEQLWGCLKRGQIHVINSDHAPATREDKAKGEQDIWAAPFGVPGIETRLPLMLNGVNEGKISLQNVVRVTAENNAKLYGLYPRKGCLLPGSDADVVLVDMNRRWTVKQSAIVSKVGWSPYEGRTLQGKPLMTFVRGQLVAQEGNVVGQAGVGAYIPGPGLNPA